MNDPLAGYGAVVSALQGASGGMYRGPAKSEGQLREMYQTIEGLDTSSLREAAEAAVGGTNEARIQGWVGPLLKFFGTVGGGMIATEIAERAVDWFKNRNDVEEVSEAADKAADAIDSTVTESDQGMMHIIQQLLDIVSTLTQILGSMDRGKFPQEFRDCVQTGADLIDQAGDMLEGLCADRDEAISQCFSALTDHGKQVCETEPKPLCSAASGGSSGGATSSAAASSGGSSSSTASSGSSGGSSSAADSSTSTNAESSVEKEKTTPAAVEKPDEKPVEKPVEKTPENPVEKPVEKQECEEKPDPKPNPKPEPDPEKCKTEPVECEPTPKPETEPEPKPTPTPTPGTPTPIPDLETEDCEPGKETGTDSESESEECAPELNDVPEESDLIGQLIKGAIGIGIVVVGVGLLVNFLEQCVPVIEEVPVPEPEPIPEPAPQPEPTSVKPPESELDKVAEPAPKPIPQANYTAAAATNYSAPAHAPVVPITPAAPEVPAVLEVPAPAVNLHKAGGW